jgi:hypothetical protein
VPIIIIAVVTSNTDNVFTTSCMEIWHTATIFVTEELVERQSLKKQGGRNGELQKNIADTFDNRISERFDHTRYGA